MNDTGFNKPVTIDAAVNGTAANEPPGENSLAVVAPPNPGHQRTRELDAEISDLCRQIGDDRREVAHLKEINRQLVRILRDRDHNIERLCTALPRTQVDAAKAHNWDRHLNDRQAQLEADVELDENDELMKPATRGHSDGFPDCPVRGIVEIGQFTVLNRLASDRRLLDVVCED